MATTTERLSRNFSRACQRFGIIPENFENENLVSTVLQLARLARAHEEVSKYFWHRNALSTGEHECSRIREMAQSVLDASTTLSGQVAVDRCYLRLLLTKDSK